MFYCKKKYILALLCLTSSYTFADTNYYFNIRNLGNTKVVNTTPENNIPIADPYTGYDYYMTFNGSHNAHLVPDYDTKNVTDDYLRDHYCEESFSYDFGEACDKLGNNNKAIKAPEWQPYGSYHYWHITFENKLILNKMLIGLETYRNCGYTLNLKVYYKDDLGNWIPNGIAVGNDYRDRGLKIIFDDINTKEIKLQSDDKACNGAKSEISELRFY